MIGCWRIQKSRRDVDLSLRFLDEAQPNEDADHDPECHDKEGHPNNGLQDGVLRATAIPTRSRGVVEMERFGRHRSKGVIHPALRGFSLGEFLPPPLCCQTDGVVWWSLDSPMHFLTAWGRWRDVRAEGPARNGRWHLPGYIQHGCAA